MDFFNYRGQTLYAEDVPLSEIAKRYGTPTYVYSKATLERHYHAFADAFGNEPHLICYAVKANSNLAVLQVLARLGAGFDIVSVGELERVLAAGGAPDKIVFSGVGKMPHEIERALEVGIHCFNVEVEEELFRIEHAAKKMGKTAPVAFRINPDVDASTHPYISTGLKENKFGIDMSEALDIFEKAAALPHIEVVGIDCHIGSQLLELQPFLDALSRLNELVAELAQRDIQLEHIDIGGGLGVPYKNEKPPTPAEYADAVFRKMKGRGHKIILEPGRAISANAGVFLTRVEYIKTTPHKQFAIVDGAMNDLLRPSIYEAWHDIIPVQIEESKVAAQYDVVGPICETGDFLGKDRNLAIAGGDLLAVRTAGAYGFVMSSNYNTRPRAAEVMVDGDTCHLVRERETIEALFAQERVLL